MRVIIILFLFLSFGSFDSTAQLFGGQLKRAKGTITALTCASTINSGNLYAGTTATAFTSFVPYSGGNGGLYNTQTITSTGATGLTATNNPGSFVQGSGYIAFTITGVPSAAGTASFLVTIGGQSCTFTVTVQATAAQYPPGSVFCASGASLVVDVTNPTTGKTWMDRNLGATQVATSSTDAAAYGDLYQWGRRSDGHQCRTSATTATLSSSDQPSNGNFILAPSAPNDWRSPQNVNLWQGLNGVNNPCPSGYRIPTVPELGAEHLSWSESTSVGAFASPLKLPMAGYRQGSSGSLIDVGGFGGYWSSAVCGTNSRYLFFRGSINAGMSIYGPAGGESVRCLKDVVGSLDTLNCGGATTTGTLTNGTAANGLSTAVSYTGGNVGTYGAQSVSSTGVVGLTATLEAGTLANGSGSLTYPITGTPTTSGTASFAITVGGQSCSFTVSVGVGVGVAIGQYSAGTVNCAGATTVVDVTNPTTGRIWMDRNLGATQVATSSTDVNSYGDLYQWGRRADGHQCRTSATTATLSSSDQPANGDFILTTCSPIDWRSPQNTNLWQGVNGVNNPCPSGYRIPTETEINAERLSWSVNTSAGAFTSPLKLPMAGYRSYSFGLLNAVGTYGYYWSSTVSGTNSRYLRFSTSLADVLTGNRAYGYSVRCLKD